MCGGQKTDLTITQTFTMETTINGLVSVLGCMQRGALGTWSMLAYNSRIILTPSDKYNIIGRICRIESL